MAALTSSYHLLSHILRTPPPSASFRSLLFRRPFSVKCFLSPSTSSPLTSAVNLHTASGRRQCSAQSAAVSLSPSTSADVLVEDSNENEDEEEDSELEDEIEAEEEDEVVREAPKSLDRSKLPKLTIKEKKELASYAHSLGKKLKVQLVGKSGVTASLASSFVETLEANELLKIKIHGTCPAEVIDVAKQLEDATGSVVVGQIGRTIILYRPSVSKMKAEEKRRQERKVFVRKESVFKPAFPTKEGIPRPAEPSFRPNRRGTRGSSRARNAEY